MNRRTTAPLALVIVSVSLILAIFTACGTSNQSASPVPASPAPSSPAASSPVSPSTSPAASKPAAASDQEYQKALADFKQVEEAARKEGEATIYSIADVITLGKLQAAFNKIDPKMQVKLIRVVGAAALERVKAEQATKQIVGNAYWGTLPQMGEEGLLQPIDLPVLKDPTTKWLVDPLMERPQPIVTTSINKVLIIYNTSLVPAGQEPKTWKELADPKWKDKILVWDPRVSSFSMDLLGLLYYNPEYGPDYVKNVVLNIRTSPDSTEAARAIARGEAPLGFSSPATYDSLKDSAPVKAFSPADGAFASPTMFQIVKGAPQVNVTRVFGNWLMSKEGQKIISEGYGTIRADVEGVNKIAQLQPGEKLLPNTPYTADFQKKLRGEPVQALTKWMNDAGR